MVFDSGCKQTFADTENLQLFQIIEFVDDKPTVTQKLKSVI